MGGMTMGGGQHLITLLNKPMDREGWSAEEVTLALLSTGDLTLRSHASGRAVEMVMGDGVTEYQRAWTVAAGQVEQVRQACVRDLFPDNTALSGWLARTGVQAAPGEWYGFTVRPVDDRQFVLEAVRTIVGVTDDDEGTTVADRFVNWLAGKGISYTTEQHADGG
jgi:hypothetical protein